MLDARCTSISSLLSPVSMALCGACGQRLRMGTVERARKAAAARWGKPGARRGRVVVVRQVEDGRSRLVAMVAAARQEVVVVGHDHWTCRRCAHRHPPVPGGCECVG